MRAALVLVMLGGCLRTPPFAGTGSGSGQDARIDDAPARMDTGGTKINGNLIFVTSTTTSVDNLNGIGGADMICAQRALEAGRSGHFVAWLSTSGMPARSRIAAARGWVRPDGKPFADTLDDLLAGTIYYPPRLDESGVDLGTVYVMTATTSVGTPAASTCSDLAGGADAIQYGLSGATTKNWTDGTAAAPCSAPMHLYCMQTDLQMPVSVPTSPLKRAFLSSPWIPSGGISGANAQCAADAAAHSLGGTFHAFLATTTTSASGQFSTATAPWARLDGVVLGDSLQQVFSGKIAAPLNVDAGGFYHIEEEVWTGAGLLGTPDTTPTGGTCQEWTMAKSSEQGGTGLANRTDVTWFGYAATTSVCSGSRPLYCLEI